MDIKCIWKSQSRQHKSIIRHCVCSNKQMNCRVFALTIPPAASLNNAVPSIQVSAKLIKYFVTKICQCWNKKHVVRGKVKGGFTVSREMCIVHCLSCQIADFIFPWCITPLKRLRWSRGSVLPLSTRVHGFKPGRSHQDFSGRKNPRHVFLWKGSKAVGPMSQICIT